MVICSLSQRLVACSKKLDPNKRKKLNITTRSYDQQNSKKNKFAGKLINLKKLCGTTTTNNNKMPESKTTAIDPKRFEPFTTALLKCPPCSDRYGNIQFVHLNGSREDTTGCFFFFLLLI